MKSAIITTAVISALTVTSIGLGTKLVLDNRSKAQSPVAIASEPVKQVASAQIAAQTASASEKPKIMSITPKYTTSQVPYKKCQMVNQTHMVANANKSGTVGGVIGGTTGAVAGGVIGKQIGGNTAGTLIGGAVGLIGGAVAGNQIEKATQADQVAQTTQVQQCHQATKSVKKLTGYTVLYNYHGVHSTVVLKDKPTGQYLPLSAIGE